MQTHAAEEYQEFSIAELGVTEYWLVRDIGEEVEKREFNIVCACVIAKEVVED